MCRLSTTDVTAGTKPLIDRDRLVTLTNGGKFGGEIGAAVVMVGRGGGTRIY